MSRSRVYGIWLAALFIIALLIFSRPIFAADVPYSDGILSLTRPVVEKPELQIPYVDPLGGSVTRLSNSRDYVSHNEGYPLIKGEYARVPIENADGSKLLVYGVWQGTGNFITSYALMDSAGGDITLVEFESSDNPARFDRLHDEMEARWHPTDPDLIRFIGGSNSARGSLKLFEYRVSDGEITVLSDLSAKLPAHWGTQLYGMTHLEGDFSADGNRLAWAIENGDEQTVGFVAFDVRNGGVVLGTLDYTDQNHDNISITPSGNYVVISGHQETASYSVDFEAKRVLMDETQHGDSCTNALGHDCYVSVIFNDSSHAQIGKVFMTDLVTGQVDSLIDVYGYGNTSLHLSGRGHDVPGWALMSTYNCLGNGIDTSTKPTSLCDRMTLVELAPNPRLYQLAWTHSSGSTYNAEPHGTLSRDGLRAYFSSDWYSIVTDDANEIDLYRVDISAAVYEDLPTFPPAPSAPLDLLPATGSRLLDTEPLSLTWRDSSPARTQSFLLVARDLQTGNPIAQQLLQQASACDAEGLCSFAVDTSGLPVNTRISFALVANGLRGSSAWVSAEYAWLHSLTPDAPEIVAPDHGVKIDTGLAPLFRWQQPEHPDAVISFDVVIENTALHVPLLHLQNYSAATHCSDNRCSMIDRDLALPESSDYRFRVRAKNISGFSEWTSLDFEIEAGAIGYIPYAEGIQSLQRPTIVKPEFGESYIDQSFFSTVKSLTAASTSEDIYGITVAKNDYSRVQVENADGSLIMLLAMHPEQGVLSYALANPDGNDLSFIAFSSGAPTTRPWMHDESEPRWHPTDPDIIRFIAGQNSYVGTLKLFEYRVSTGAVTVLANLEGKLPEAWGEQLYGMTLYEGGASADGNRYAWAIENGREDSVGFVSFDVREGGIVLGTLDYNNHQHDNVAISHSGNYVVISGADETASYSIDFSEKRVLMNEGQHADLCRMANGDDCYVSISFDDPSSENYGKVFVINLVNGEVTTLFDVFGQGNTSLHFSGRGYDVPGWVLVSTYNCSAGVTATDSTSLCDRIFLVELAENPKIYNIAWAHSSGSPYYAEPHASLSRDGERIYFGSDWYSGSAVELYRVDINPALYGVAADHPPSAVSPTALSPKNKAPRTAGADVVFEWSVSDLSAVEGFVVDVIESPDSPSVYRNTNIGVDACNQAGHCKYALEASAYLDSNAARTWRVQSQGRQDSSSWSGSSYQLYGKPDVPELISPLAGAEYEIGAAVAVEWAADASGVADAYDVYLYDRALKSYAVKETGLASTDVCDQSGMCRYVLPAANALAEYKNHFVSLRSRNPSGVSAWVRVNFDVMDSERVLPPLVTIDSPEDNVELAIGAALEVSWRVGEAANEKSIATGFDVRIFDRTLEKHVVREIGVSPADICDAGGLCRYKLSAEAALPESTRHFVLVRSRNIRGVSAWSRINFHVVDSERTLPPAVTIVTPEANAELAIGDALEVSWRVGEAANEKSVATGFDVYIFDRTLKKYVIKERGLSPAATCDAGGLCRYQLAVGDALPESAYHYLLVRSQSIRGVSAWSRANFHVVDSERSLPPVVSIVTPEANAELAIGDALEVSWRVGEAANDKSVATGFDVFIYDRTLKSYVVKERGLAPADVCDAGGLCRYQLAAEDALPVATYHRVLVRSSSIRGVSAWKRKNFHVVP